MTVTRLFDLLARQLAERPREDALAYKVKGQWKKYSSREFQEIVDKLSLGLMKMGIERGDKVAIISFNRPEWNFVDFAIQQVGAISVPMYPTITVEDYRFIFQDAGVKMVFVENTDLLQKVTNAIEGLDSVKQIFTFDQIKSANHWSEVMEYGKDQDFAKLQAAKDAVQNSDLFTLIYTSGTTGKPKGVMLTHNNVLSNVLAMTDRLPFIYDKYNNVLSFLPLCHIFERTAAHLFIYNSISIYYAESMETIPENLKEVQPVAFTTVPRLLEKVYDKIVAKGLELKGIKKGLFFWALNLGLEYDPAVKKGWWYNYQLKIANKIIFNKWREALGGKIEFIATGAAALQPRLGRVFWAAGIPVLEGYGLTETSPGVCFSEGQPENVRLGTVGPALDQVEVKIAADGEILVKGPNVMVGYYNRPEQTAEAIDEEGWFHTGDIGEFVEGRFLKITDRKKEMFKTSGGKYIAPQVIENKFKESLVIEQVMVVGEGKKFPSALIVPFEQGLKEWCSHKGLPFTNLSKALKMPEVQDKFAREVERMNQDFAQYEKIKKFRLLADSWTIEGGELTPTLKLKRRNILKTYHDVIEEMYSE
jgi:long-chain acyl-CoA synthetase